MAYPSYAPVGRQRRRRWLLTLLVAVIIISIVVFAVRRRSDARGIADYLAVAQQVATEQGETADDLEALFLTVTDVERPEVMRRLEVLRVSSEDASETLAGTDVPLDAGEVHGYLVAAVSSWSSGLNILDDAIVVVLDESAEAGGTELLQEAFDFFRLGDLAYTQFLAATDGFDDAVPVGDIDVVAFAGEDRSVEYDAQMVTLRLTSVHKLGELHDIAVTAVTDPEPLGERNNVPVVPHSEQFIVQAVVANQGNEPEHLVSVDLELIPTDDSEERVTVRQTVADLEPGQARTLVFDTLELQPGGLYEVVITAEVDKDEDSENDAWRMVFYQNENT
ncbi:MAG: hypothetical protein U9N79_07740 [Actinomycetota bacterium]|nr:hypothetical protein [Actinomycetota bacterium]